MTLPQCNEVEDIVHRKRIIFPTKKGNCMARAWTCIDKRESLLIESSFRMGMIGFSMKSHETATQTRIYGVPPVPQSLIHLVSHKLCILIRIEGPRETVLGDLSLAPANIIINCIKGE
jgi:hypothetical protein